MLLRAGASCPTPAREPSPWSLLPTLQNAVRVCRSWIPNLGYHWAHVTLAPSLLALPSSRRLSAPRLPCQPFFSILFEAQHFLSLHTTLPFEFPTGETDVPYLRATKLDFLFCPILSYRPTLLQLCANCRRPPLRGELGAAPLAIFSASFEQRPDIYPPLRPATSTEGFETAVVGLCAHSAGLSAVRKREATAKPAHRGHKLDRLVNQTVVNCHPWSGCWASLWFPTICTRLAWANWYVELWQSIEGPRRPPFPHLHHHPRCCFPSQADPRDKPPFHFFPSENNKTNREP